MREAAPNVMEGRLAMEFFQQTEWEKGKFRYNKNCCDFTESARWAGVASVEKSKVLYLGHFFHGS